MSRNVNLVELFASEAIGSGVDCKELENGVLEARLDVCGVEGQDVESQE